MTPADDIALVQRFYDARGDRTVIGDVISHQIVWDITPGFPLAGVYTGIDAVLTDLLANLGSRVFSSLVAKPQRFFADGDGHVVALGHYAATGPGGCSTDSRFAHVWTIEGAKLARMDQVADTLVLDRILHD